MTTPVSLTIVSKSRDEKRGVTMETIGRKVPYCAEDLEKCGLLLSEEFHSSFPSYPPLPPQTLPNAPIFSENTKNTVRKVFRTVKMGFYWEMPVSWTTTFLAAGLGFLPVLFAGLNMASPSCRSSPEKLAVQFEEGLHRWEDEQARRGHGGMDWMADREYSWGDNLLDRRGVRYNVSVPGLVRTLSQADNRHSGLK
jgi:hypothetical protein